MASGINLKVAAVDGAVSRSIETMAHGSGGVQPGVGNVNHGPSAVGIQPSSAIVNSDINMIEDRS
jgi:hypothetical protein